MPTGTNPTYVSGTGHRPVPMATDLLYRHAHAPQPKKPTGLDWAALTPRCKACGEKSRQLNNDDTCPTCAGPIEPPPPKPPKQRRSTASRAPRPPREPRTGHIGPRATTNVAEIKRLYLEEMLSIAKVSDATGHSRNTIRKVLLDAKIELRDDRRLYSGGANRIEAYPEEFVADVRRLYLDHGLTQAETAQQLGVSPKVIYTTMAKHKIPARPDAFSPGGRGRVNPVEGLKARIDALDTTAREIKEWAIRQGLLHEMQVGLPPSRIIDAFIKAAGVEIERPAATLAERDAEIRQFAIAAPAFTIRTWAARNGHSVGERGPIPFETRLAYATWHYNDRRYR